MYSLEAVEGGESEESLVEVVDLQNDDDEEGGGGQQFDKQLRPAELLQPDVHQAERTGRQATSVGSHRELLVA